ncbi:hypothetical protein Vafri_14810 [Volvox africanus]|uniref:Peptidase S54 rhomboid domain-containing protein n=1 Tax=Volvox africanus TaxID=51714 RepID=A0A8J4BFC7_9CHLO|nr:hypothetical protein Vafri_14810 [Volvox africanus]
MLLSGRVPIAERPQKSVIWAKHLRLPGFIPTYLRAAPSFHKQLFALPRRTCARWTSQRVLAQKESTSSSNTIKSLESILGSNDGEDDVDPGRYTGGYNDVSVRKRNVPEAAPRRVRPLYVYVIYYCFIVVYLATAWLQATDGDLAASILVDGLVNDHLAVASGQVPRLATAGFVCEGPLELFLQLATLLTVGAEAEALLGYSLFWAVYWLANLGGGLADSAFSELPVTYGPANAAAGMVGALVAYYGRNLGLEERIAAARQAVRQRRRQILDGVGSGSMSDTPLPPGRRSLEDTETEVEVLPLLSIKISARMSSTAKGLLNVLVALVVAGQGLLDFGDASSSASWIGLIAAFWTGLLLTFGAGPQYDVQYKLPERPHDSNGSGSGSSSSSGLLREGKDANVGGSSKATAAHGSAASPQMHEAGRDQTPILTGEESQADDDGLTVVDVCPPSRRRAVLGGYVAGLAVLICGWLTWMDADI